MAQMRDAVRDPGLARRAEESLCDLMIAVPESAKGLLRSMAWIARSVRIRSTTLAELAIPRLCAESVKRAELDWQGNVLRKHRRPLRPNFTPGRLPGLSSERGRTRATPRARSHRARRRAPVTQTMRTVWSGASRGRVWSLRDGPAQRPSGSFPNGLRERVVSGWFSSDKMNGWEQ